MLTNDQIQDARQRAAQMLAEAGFVLPNHERDDIEVADFSLSELEQTGRGIVVYVSTARVCAKETSCSPARRAPSATHRSTIPRQGGGIPLPQGPRIPLRRGCVVDLARRSINESERRR